MRTGPRGQDLTRQERIESEYWRRSSASASDLHSIASLTNTINKFTDAGVFLTSLLPFRDVFAGARSILEIGAGQGWASCIVKRLFPNARVTTTDISPWALKAIPTWEHLFQARVDGVFASRSDEVPLAGGSVQCAFCFSSAHHFRAHRPTLQEIHRVLAPGGHAFYFFEPSCPRVWHRAAVWRVTRKRPDVPEDVLVRRAVQEHAAAAGLSCQITFEPQLFKRAPVETLYYGLLQSVPPLQKLLPCTATYHFSKQSA
jgi:SAM-dependent methyltransferase